MQGYDAVLTTGSDEHGVNVERAAEARRKTPKEFTDAISAEFERQWELLGLRRRISSAPPTRKHARVVQGCSSAAGQRLRLQGQLHRPVLHLRQPLRQRGQARRPLPRLRPPTETVTEENFFFKLSAFQDKLLELYERTPSSFSPRRAATK
jgi:methionyl-tRNA synthetase